MYPQQATYGQSQQYPFVGQMQTAPGQMYADFTQAQQYSSSVALPAISAKPSPVQEGCVGRSCDQSSKENSNSSSDKLKHQIEQDNLAPKPSKASAPYTIQVPFVLYFVFFPSSL